MSVTITVLYDNRVDNCLLQEGWGFSALIEYLGFKILFDTGVDAQAFAKNATILQLPYQKITHLLFSHKHPDHIAGFKQIIKMMSKETALYLPKTFPWLLAWHGSRHLKNTTIVHSFEAIAPHIYSLVLRGGFWLYEQALVLKTPQGLGIITGCAHPGIINIIKAAQNKLQDTVAFVLGGFHHFRSSSDECAQIVSQFQKLEVQKAAPCHCSGDLLINQFQEAYGKNFCKVGTGTVLTF